MMLMTKFGTLMTNGRINNEYKKQNIGVKTIGDFSILPDSEMEIVLEKFKNYGLNVKHKRK